MNQEQPTEQEMVDQVYAFAADLMVNQEKGPRVVKQELINQGLDEESAATVVSNLENQISEAKREAGRKDMIYGALWCVGGTVATVSNIGFIFWGAILFGGIQFIRGASRYFSE